MARTKSRIRDGCIDVPGDPELPRGELMVVNLEVSTFLPGVASMHVERSFVRRVERSSPARRTIRASGCSHWNRNTQPGGARSAGPQLRGEAGAMKEENATKRRLKGRGHRSRLLVALAADATLIEFVGRVARLGLRGGRRRARYA